MLIKHGASVTESQWAGLEWDEKVKDSEPKSEISRAAPKKADDGGMQPMDESEDQRKSAAAAAPKTTAAAASSIAASAVSSSSVHPLIRGLDTSVYRSYGHHEERRWGLTEGLLIEACQYKGESNQAACKRLLFQHSLQEAVDADPYGDVDEVKRLVQLWLDAEKSGARMFPLCYRADAFCLSPLQIAIAYEQDDKPCDNIILCELLRLPHSFHVQSASDVYMASQRAIEVENFEGLQMLLKAGCDVNCRDVVTGRACLHVAVCELPEEKIRHGDTEPSRLSDAELQQHCQMLLDAGAQLLLTDSDGNNVYHLLAFLGDSPHLFHFFLQKLKESGQVAALRGINHAGNTPMHYVMASEFEDDTDVKNLIYLSRFDKEVNEPTNNLGHTPLQQFAGRTSDEHIDAISKALRIPREQLLAIRHPTRPKVGLHVAGLDATQGFEDPNVKVPMLSEYEVNESDFHIYKYIESHQPTSKETQAFCEAMITPPTKAEAEAVRGGEMDDAADLPAMAARQMRMRLADVKEDTTNYERIQLKALEVRFTPEKGWGQRQLALAA